jgi:methionyl-tRNA formyltransferase
LLPKYRGAAPTNWAIVNGETETGVTTMFMEPTLDTGPILLQGSTAIGETETAPQLMHRLSEFGAELLRQTLMRLDVLTPQPQDHSKAPIIKKEDGLIDWSRPAIVIERAIRGFQPWPTAYTTFSSRRLTIWEAEQLLCVAPEVEPGEVTVAHGGELVVQCGGRSALRLLDVQPEARKRLTPRDFINGMHVKVGDCLGKE